MIRISCRNEALFADALAQPPAERGAFLAKACGADVDLLAHLIALVAAHDGPDDLLAFPSPAPNPKTLTTAGLDQVRRIIRETEPLRPSTRTPRDIQVQVLGGSAVASYYMDGSTRWPDGTTDSRPRRVTEIWVKDGGTWKEAHHHDSVYTPAPAVRAAQ